MKTPLKAVQPYSFQKSMSVYSRLKYDVVDIFQDNEYKRVLFNELVTVDSKLNLSYSGKKKIKKKISEMLSLDYDLKPFYKYASDDAFLNNAVQKMYGVKATRTPSFFEAIVIAISEQQLSILIGVRFKSKLAQRYGLEINGQYGFPDAEKIASLKPDDIRKLGYSWRKSEYIIEAAKQDFSGIEKLSTEDAINELVKIRGIGPWTAEYALIRGLGRYDAVPATDLAISKIISREYYKGKPVTETQVRKKFDEWGDFKGYAAYYLLRATSKYL